MNRKYPDNPNGQGNPEAYKNAGEHGSHIIVASEPSTYKREQWNLLPKNHFLSVDKDCRVEVMPMAIPAELMVQARATHHA